MSAGNSEFDWTRPVELKTCYGQVLPGDDDGLIGDALKTLHRVQSLLGWGYKEECEIYSQKITGEGGAPKVRRWIADLDGEETRRQAQELHDIIIDTNRRPQLKSFLYSLGKIQDE
jgi:hypothetical protein